MRESLLALIVTFGFGIIFNIRGKNLIFATIGGALSWIIYSFSLNMGVSVIGAMFIAAILFSIYSEICARMLRTPVTTISICSLILFVPGSNMYYTMYAVVQRDINQALELGITTLAQAGALAIGIALVSTIVRLISSHKRKCHDN